MPLGAPFPNYDIMGKEGRKQIITESLQQGSHHAKRFIRISVTLWIQFVSEEAVILLSTASKREEMSI